MTTEVTDRHRSVAAHAERRLFETGFEGTTRLVPSEGPFFHGARQQYEDFRGSDPTVLAPNNCDDMLTDPVFGSFRIYYEGGNTSQRHARIVPDEADPSNKVLRFWIGDPNVQIDHVGHATSKARVQAEIYRNTNFREFYQSVRVRFHPDLALLKEYPDPFAWFTLIEYWNKPFWSEAGDVHVPYPFRMSLGLKKLVAGCAEALYFGAESQVMLSDSPNFKVEEVWNQVNIDFPVPFGVWLTLETYYLEGDRETGRYYCAVTPEGGPRITLFDIHDATHHPDNPVPDGLTHYNPIKIYTSGAITQFLQARGAALQIDWDDFSLWSGRGPESDD